MRPRIELGTLIESLAAGPTAELYAVCRLGVRCCLPLIPAVLPKDFTTAAAYRWRTSCRLPYTSSASIFSSYLPCICIYILFAYYLPFLPSYLYPLTTLPPGTVDRSLFTYTSRLSSSPILPPHRHEYPSTNSYYQPSASSLRNIQPGLLLFLCWPGQRLLWCVGLETSIFLLFKLAGRKLTFSVECSLQLRSMRATHRSRYCFYTSHFTLFFELTSAAARRYPGGHRYCRDAQPS